MLEFKSEVQAFEAALPKLLKAFDGQFVVIHGGVVEQRGFPTYEEALGWGYEQFGLARFYVKQIGDKAHTTQFRRGFVE